MKSLAGELGLSVQSVSLALGGRRGVSEATRERVRAHAAARGYRPDAGLRALADYRTRGRQASTRWNRVALLHNWHAERAITADSFYSQWYSHLDEAAAERGIRIELHWVGAQNERADAVFRLLRNRGITGVFLAPPGLTPDPLAVPVPVEDIQIVTFGPEHLYPAFHTVQFDYYENLRIAWRILRRRGHSRIGLVYAQNQGWRTGHAWKAAYHVEKTLAGVPPGDQLPLELDGGSEVQQKKQYRAWLRNGKYDAVISSMRQVPAWAPAGRNSPETALFNVAGSGRQGIDLNLQQMGQTAMELLYLELQRSLINARSLPFRVHIPGKWVEAVKTPD
ncbi:MAG: LacI family DNA-binding transcriptional regulator [Verrucomicrobia bacterium]|nr:LacI family DNA-binding transcriptional regulator [Verrucomicrobiota bacterium]MCH8527999.1 LacI family DNA-binding transcriptional regulator [Kiritimatiellia bacterium]